MKVHFAFAIVAMSYAVYVAMDLYQLSERIGARNRAAATQVIENSKCALRGLVLLRGQLGEFVCVVPGSERTRVKP